MISQIQSFLSASFSSAITTIKANPIYLIGVSILIVGSCFAARKWASKPLIRPIVKEPELPAAATLTEKLTVEGFDPSKDYFCIEEDTAYVGKLLYTPFILDHWECEEAFTLDPKANLYTLTQLRDHLRDHTLILNVAYEVDVIARLIFQEIQDPEEIKNAQPLFDEIIRIKNERPSYLVAFLQIRQAVYRYFSNEEVEDLLEGEKELELSIVASIEAFRKGDPSPERDPLIEQAIRDLCKFNDHRRFGLAFAAELAFCKFSSAESAKRCKDFVGEKMGLFKKATVPPKTVRQRAPKPPVSKERDYSAQAFVKYLASAKLCFASALKIAAEIEDEKLREQELQTLPIGQLAHEGKIDEAVDALIALEGDTLKKARSYLWKGMGSNEPFKTSECIDLLTSWKNYDAALKFADKFSPSLKEQIEKARTHNCSYFELDHYYKDPLK